MRSVRREGGRAPVLRFASSADRMSYFSDPETFVEETLVAWEISDA